MDLKRELDELLSLEDGEPLFLSVYLDTSVNPDGQRTYGVFLKKKTSLMTKLQRHKRGETGVRELRENIRRLEAYLAEHLKSETRGLALFCSTRRGYFKALELPVPVRNKFAVSTSPNLDVLIELVEESRHYAITVLDQHSGRIFSLHLSDRPGPETSLSQNVPGRTKVGGFSQMRYQRHRKDRIQHFMRDFAEQLERFDRREKPQGLVLLGTHENVSEFKRRLPRHLLEKVVLTRGIPAHEDEQDLISQVRRFVEQIEAQESHAALSQFYDRLCQDYLTVVGLDETLFNLQMGKVERLFVTDRLAGRGYRCINCDFVFCRNVHKCPYCTGPAEAVDIRNRIEKLAELHGAQLELLDEPSFLDELGGVGGMLKF